MLPLLSSEEKCVMAGQVKENLTKAQEIQWRVQFAFIFISGCITLICGAGLPFLSYIALSLLGIATVRSLPQWSKLASLEAQAPATPLDTTSKFIIAGSIMVFGFLFMQLALISQIILCTAAGAGIAGLFVHECILRSQLALNNALANTAKTSQADNCAQLLERGADPFALDAHGNHAFHLSVRNDAHAEAVIKHLQTKATQEEMEFVEILHTAKDYFTDPIFERWRQCAMALRTLVREYNFDNRSVFFQATSDLLQSYHAPMINTLNKLTQYLRQRMAYPKEINAQNVLGQTPIDLIKTQAFDRAIQHALTKKLKEMGAKETPASSVPAVIPSDSAANDKEAQEKSTPAPVTADPKATEAVRSRQKKHK